MTANAILQLGVYLLVLLALVKPLGAYMALVFADAPNRITLTGAPLERLLYRIAGIRADEDMGWKRYALAMLVFNVIGLLFVYLLQRVQQWLPLNPQGFGAFSADSAMNTAISFATQHQLAGLRRRVDDELPDPDARPQRAELPVRGDRRCGAHRIDPWLRAPQRRPASAISGSM